LPEIPPVLPFSKGGELFGIRQRIPSTFPPLEKGDDGGFYGFPNNQTVTLIYIRRNKFNVRVVEIPIQGARIRFG
jgi:hypothetical protein